MRKAGTQLMAGGTQSMASSQKAGAEPATSALFLERAFTPGKGESASLRWHLQGVKHTMGQTKVLGRTSAAFAAGGISRSGSL